MAAVTITCMLIRIRFSLADIRARRRAAALGRALFAVYPSDRFEIRIGRRSIDSKDALDAPAISRLSFEPWTSKSRIRMSSTCLCSSESTARRTWRVTTSFRSNQRCLPNGRWCAAGAASAAPSERGSTSIFLRPWRKLHSTHGSSASAVVVTNSVPDDTSLAFLKGVDGVWWRPPTAFSLRAAIRRQLS